MPSYMLDFITKLFAGNPVEGKGGKVSSGAKGLTPLPLPKVPKAAQAVPSYLSKAKPDESQQLVQADRRLTSRDLLDYAKGPSTWQIVRDFAASSPDIAAAKSAYIRLAVTDEYSITAKSREGRFDAEATKLARQIALQMDYIGDTSGGFSGIWSLRSVAESLACELLLCGSCSSELVLDKARLPLRVQPISVSSIKYFPDNGQLHPKQKVGGDLIDLNIPTFFIVTLDQDLLTAYSSSVFESALKSIVFSENFIADLQRVVKRAGFPRFTVELSEETVRKNAPPEIQGDAQAMSEYFKEVTSAVKELIDGLRPEDALILLDTMKVGYTNSGGFSLANECVALQEIIQAQIASGVKTLPSILGHGTGNSSAASTESLLFMKSAAGAIQFKLNEMFSKVFTLAARLYGRDCVVDFKFKEIDLRPDIELEAFRALEQARVLELVSLGYLTDEEGCLALTGNLPPEGFVPLSGTMFKSQKVDGNPNPDGTSNGGSALNKKLNSGVATGVKGQNNKADPMKD